MKPLRFVLMMISLFSAPMLWAQETELAVEHESVDSSGVKIHCATQGDGPLVVMIHGFPDYWYSWRQQIPALAKDHKVVAIDQRGFNLSDKPDGVENYAIPKLVGDVKAGLLSLTGVTVTLTVWLVALPLPSSAVTCTS